MMPQGIFTRNNGIMTNIFHDLLYLRRPENSEIALIFRYPKFRKLECFIKFENVLKSGKKRREC
jgi:hypothetical protein